MKVEFVAVVTPAVAAAAVAAAAAAAAVAACALLINSFIGLSLTPSLSILGS